MGVTVMYYKIISMDSHETWAPAVGGGGKRRRCPGACPGGGGLPPPLEIEKQKKKVIRANLKLVHLYLATFLVVNTIFSPIF